MSSVSERGILLGDAFVKEVSSTYPNTMPPVVESTRLLNRKDMYLCKKDIVQKAGNAPAARKEGNPTAINFIQLKVHTPGLCITEVNLGIASKNPVKIGKDIGNMRSIGPISF